MIKFYATCALQITGLVLVGFALLGLVALVIKGYGALLCGSC